MVFDSASMHAQHAGTTSVPPVPRVEPDRQRTNSSWVNSGVICLSVCPWCILIHGFLFAIVLDNSKVISWWGAGRDCSTEYIPILTAFTNSSVTHCSSWSMCFLPWCRQFPVLLSTWPSIIHRPLLHFRRLLKIVLCSEFLDKIIIGSQFILGREDSWDRRSHSPLSSRRHCHIALVRWR